ncbi:hypothetical protein V1514DRAFT_310305, partial [Lipomyces japonicus]|uniref:uncharacterized protein n=1 Tax=Lipomyces japonicus TaxID=56871 RepID=UPI0034CE1622
MPSSAISSNLSHLHGAQAAFSPEIGAFQPLSPADTAAPVFPLKIRNLPLDISKREFNLLFTFAPDYLHSELLSSSTTTATTASTQHHHHQQEDYIGGSPVVGIAYFKSYTAALQAHDVLDARSDLFFASSSASSILQSSPPASTAATSSSSASSPHYPLPLICEFPAKPSSASAASSFDLPFHHVQPQLHHHNHHLPAHVPPFSQSSQP